MVRLGHAHQGLSVLEAALKHENEWVRLRAANAIDNLDEKARPLLPAMKAALKDKNEYVVRVIEHALADLERNEPRPNEPRP